MVEQRPIRAAEDKRPGVTVFYCPSETEPNTDYVVQYMRRKIGARYRRFWSCTCPNYVYEQLSLGRHCKHIRRVREEAEEQKGVRKLAQLAA